MFKQANYREGLQVYIKLIQSLTLIDFNKTEIDEIIQDILSFSIEETNVELLLLISNLEIQAKYKKYKKDLIIQIFNQWKSFDYLLFFKTLKQKGFYE